MLPSGRWALTPPFHPYQALSPSAARLRGPLSGRPKVFLQMATEAHCTGGLFSVALSVAGNLASLARIARRVSPLALPGALPDGVRTFLPACLLAKAAQRSPGLPATVSIPSCSGRVISGGLGKIHRTAAWWRRLQPVGVSWSTFVLAATKPHRLEPVPLAP